MQRQSQSHDVKISSNIDGINGGELKRNFHVRVSFLHEKNYIDFLF